MTTSILNDCLLRYKERPGQLKDYFKSINLEIFDEFYKFSAHELEAEQKILFVLCAYSEDSPLVILRQGATKEKDGICEYLGIPQYMRGNLIHLDDDMVRHAATEYLEQFAGFEFKNLMFMKIQLNDWEREITNRGFGIEKSEEKDGTTTTIKTYDIKEHAKAVTETRRLASAIEKLEKEIRSKKKYLAIEDVKLWVDKTNVKSGVRKANPEYSDKIN